MKAARMARARLRSSAWVKVIAGDLLTLIHTRATGFCAAESAAVNSIANRARKVNSKLIKYVECLSMQNQDGSWGNDLETAFGAVTLLNLGYHGNAVERAIKVILARQSDDDGWALAPAYRRAVAPLNYGARAHCRRLY